MYKYINIIKYFMSALGIHVYILFYSDIKGKNKKINKTMINKNNQIIPQSKQSKVLNSTYDNNNASNTPIITTDDANQQIIENKIIEYLDNQYKNNTKPVSKSELISDIMYAGLIVSGVLLSAKVVMQIIKRFMNKNKNIKIKDVVKMQKQSDSKQSVIQSKNLNLSNKENYMQRQDKKEELESADDDSDDDFKSLPDSDEYKKEFLENSNPNQSNVVNVNETQFFDSEDQEQDPVNNEHSQQKNDAIIQALAQEPLYAFKDGKINHIFKKKLQKIALMPSTLDSDKITQMKNLVELAKEYNLDKSLKNTTWETFLGTKLTVPRIKMLYNFIINAYIKSLPPKDKEVNIGNAVQEYKKAINEENIITLLGGEEHFKKQYERMMNIEKLKQKEDLEKMALLNKEDVM